MTDTLSAPASRRKLFVEVGQRFTRGVVIDPEIRIVKPSTKPGHSGQRGARLRCDCGNVYEAQLVDLYRPKWPVRSCGCHATETLAEASRSAKNRDHLARLNRSPEHRAQAPKKHGLSKHPHFYTWANMMQRCYNPKDPGYKNYGGRGVTVCPEWHDVAVFLAYIDANLGACPAGMSLDRENNDGNYEPGNVRWADRKTQLHNRRGGPGRPLGRGVHGGKKG